MFSMVVSGFHCLSRFRFSILPLAWLTLGMLILFTKEIWGGFMGYSGPHTIFSP